MIRRAGRVAHVSGYGYHDAAVTEALRPHRLVRADCIRTGYGMCSRSGMCDHRGDVRAGDVPRGEHPKEHAEEADRLGGMDAYRVRMVNALLGVVQTEATMADGVKLDEDAHHAAWGQQLTAAGAGRDEDPAERVEFIRWQVLRPGTPLRLMAQNRRRTADASSASLHSSGPTASVSFRIVAAVSWKAAIWSSRLFTTNSSVSIM